MFNDRKHCILFKLCLAKEKVEEEEKDDDDDEEEEERR